jgi:hypothetical protein
MGAEDVAQTAELVGGGLLLLRHQRSWRTLLHIVSFLMKKESVQLANSAVWSGLHTSTNKAGQTAKTALVSY